MTEEALRKKWLAFQQGKIWGPSAYDVKFLLDIIDRYRESLIWIANFQSDELARHAQMMEEEAKRVLGEE